MTHNTLTRRVWTITCLLLLLNLACTYAGASWTHPKTQPLPHKHLGPFIKLVDGSVMAADDQQVLISKDDGKTWEERPLFDDLKKFKARGERALLQTKKGTIILVILNEAERNFKWDDKKGGPQPDCLLPVYVVRSTDGGQNWLAPQVLQDNSWCGAVRSMIQTKSGRIVVAVSKALPDPGRHIMLTYYSDDEGASWKHSNIIDLGGSGDHAGAMEGSIVELADGRIYQLIRTQFGRFWEAFSNDDGESWRTIRPSTIDASSSPGLLHRMESGRIVLLWNRFRDPVKQLGPREELSVAFSEDECKTWSKPVVIVRDITPSGEKPQYHRQSYPYAYEHEPGTLWITTMQGMNRLSLKEKDFLPQQSSD